MHNVTATLVALTLAGIGMALFFYGLVYVVFA